MEAEQQGWAVKICGPVDMAGAQRAWLNISGGPHLVLHVIIRSAWSHFSFCEQFPLSAGSSSLKEMECTSLSLVR